MANADLLVNMSTTRNAGARVRNRRALVHQLFRDRSGETGRRHHALPAQGLH